MHASSHIAAILLKKTGRRTLTMLSFLKIENVMEGVAGDECRLCLTQRKCDHVSGRRAHVSVQNRDYVRQQCLTGAVYKKHPKHTKCWGWSVTLDQTQWIYIIFRRHRCQFVHEYCICSCRIANLTLQDQLLGPIKGLSCVHSFISPFSPPGFYGRPWSMDQRKVLFQW